MSPLRHLPPRRPAWRRRGLWSTSAASTRRSRSSSHWRGDTEDTGVLFVLGLAATQASLPPDVSEERRELLLNLAIASFRVILINSPELVRVRLELARAFFLKGEDSLSQRHFESVLAGNLPEPVVANDPKLSERDQGDGGAGACISV